MNNNQMENGTLAINLP